MDLELRCCFCKADVREAVFLEHVRQQTSGMVVCGGLNLTCPSCQNSIWVPILQSEPLCFGKPEATGAILVDFKRDRLDGDYMLSKRPDGEKKSN
ncbi:MAG TPA: hypothetical protein VJL32_01275 [Candidatus Paceibacterota bacterium]